MNKAQWITVPAGIQRSGLAFVACLLSVACGPSIDGRPGTATTWTTSIGMTSSDSLSDCRRIEVPTEVGFVPGMSWYYRVFEQEEFGDEVLLDFFNVEILKDQEGRFDLGAGKNKSYSTCNQCVLVSVDNASTFYFQESGELEVDEGSKPTKGELEIDLVNVKLIEVEIDDATWATTPVEGGDCLEIDDVEITSRVVEDDWSCAPAYFDAADGCHCGCGAPDPDCTGDGRAACDWCDSQGSCNLTMCPGHISAEDNSQCSLSAWYCDDALYDAGDGSCDCGCGLVDPDCDGNASVEACDTCLEEGSCAIGLGATECVGAINTVRNASCAPTLGWTCDPSYYSSDDGCDCGCGVKDPDCAGGGSDACEFCNEIGSCAEGLMGCNRISSSDTGQCN